LNNKYNKKSNYNKKNKNIYERFVILRFDIIYKIRITQWPKWNMKSIILPCKDITWHSTKLYNDIIFIIDQDYCDIFNSAVGYMLNIDKMPISSRISHHNSMPHHIGLYLYLNNLKLDTMYEGLYDTVVNHPLYIFQRTL
jgi:hypothetical protein